MMPRLSLLCRALAVLVLLASCSVRQGIDLRADGSATVTVAVDLQPAFADWLEEMAQEASTLGLKQGKAASPFDPASIRAGAAAFKGVTVTSLETPSKEKLLMTLELADITSLEASGSVAAGPPLVSIERHGAARIMRVHLDQANYRLIRPLIPGSENSLLDVLGPQEKPYTEAEYDDVLAFTIGEQAPQWARASRIEVTVRVPGKVLSQQGGGRIAGDSVRFDIPLLDVLRLARPLDYAIEFEPGG